MDDQIIPLCSQVNFSDSSRSNISRFDRSWWLVLNESTLDKDCREWVAPGYTAIPGVASLNDGYIQHRGVARGRGRGGANRPGRRVEGAPMKPTIISTKLLFHRIILVCFSEKSVSIDVFPPQHWQKNRYDLPKIWKCWVQIVLHY